jgi:hypothetical protein
MVENLKMTLFEGSRVVSEMEPKTRNFKTGSKGFYISEIVVVGGKAHRCNVLLIELGSKKKKEE